MVTNRAKHQIYNWAILRKQLTALTIFAKSFIIDVWQGSEYVSVESEWINLKTSVIRQKGESENVCFKKTKHAKFSQKRTFLTHDTHMYMCLSVVRNVCFSENLACFVFLKHPFWNRPFALLPTIKAIEQKITVGMKYLYCYNIFIVSWCTK